MSDKEISERAIIFFDGTCGLCNWFIDWVLRKDQSESFRFATLQGEYARSRFGDPNEDPSKWSVVLCFGCNTYYESDAALRVLGQLGGIFRGFLAFLWLPKVFRDAAYRLVAVNRYGWFGKRDTCRVPTAQERHRFLP